MVRILKLFLATLPFAVILFTVCLVLYQYWYAVSMVVGVLLVVILGAAWVQWAVEYLEWGDS